MIHLQHVVDTKPIMRNWQHLTQQLNFERIVVTSWLQLKENIINCASLNSMWIDFESFNNDPTKRVSSIHPMLGTLTDYNINKSNIVINVPHNVCQNDLAQITKIDQLSVVIRSDLKIKRISETCASHAMLQRTYASPSVSHMLLGKPALFSPTKERKPHVSWLVPSCSRNLSNNVLQDLREHHRICINSFETWHTLIHCLMMPSYVTDMVVIDHAVLCANSRASLIDVVSCVHTIYQITSLTNSRQLKLYVAVNGEISSDSVREIAKTPGVSGVMPVPMSGFVRQDLESAMELALHNKSWWPIFPKNSVFTNHVNKLMPKLTNRQQQIFDLVASQGANNKVIANRLKITEGAVKSHMGKLLKKFGVTSRTELAALNHS